MRHAVIDVGSNTVRTVIHEINAQEHTIIHNARDFIGIIGYIKNNFLSHEGMEILSASLERMADICSGFECDRIHCFATASLRNIENSSDVLDMIYRRSGINVKIISGKDEILYDLAGLLSAEDISDGTGLDLGGGSCQIFTFENKKLTDSVCLPVGSLRMYEKFSSEHDIYTKVYEYVSELLSEHASFRGSSHKDIYAIGGTARIAEKVCGEINGGGADIRLPDLDMILSPEHLAHARSIVSRICPERADSLFTGCAVLKAVCEYVGAEKIRIVQAGVREGFFIYDYFG